MICWGGPAGVETQAWLLLGFCRFGFRSTLLEPLGASQRLLFYDAPVVRDVRVSSLEVDHAGRPRSIHRSTMLLSISSSCWHVLMHCVSTCSEHALSTGMCVRKTMMFSLAPGLVLSVFCQWGFQLGLGCRHYSCVCQEPAHPHDLHLSNS